MTVLKHIDFEVPGFGEFAQGPQLKRGYRSEVLADNPIAYYRHNESSGIVLVDEQGNDNGNYLPTSGSTWTGGSLQQAGPLALDSDKAVKYDGSTGYVDVPDHVDFATSTVAVEAWVKINPIPAPRAIIQRRTTANVGGWVLSIFHSPLKFNFYVYVNSAWHLAASNTVSTGIWYHLAGSYDGSVARLYINGALGPTTASVTGSVNDPTSPLVQIVRHTTAGTFLDAWIDEIAVYESLTAQRIADHYNTGIAQ